MDLCRRLLISDTDEEVVQLLKAENYWDDDTMWRPVGDNENNRAIIGNQQEDAVSALAEKITNSVDAVLINRCLEAGIKPTGSDAPTSMRAAIAQFFVGGVSETAGMTRYWGTDRLTTGEIELIAKNIWLSATGSKDKPSITVADRGEGQTPDNFPKTFMSLIGFKTTDGRTESQKKDIPFVQGQFNMGGSGVYPFSSKKNGLQLLISRRNPALLPSDHSNRDEEWGFTVVRRRRAQSKGSVYEYLAQSGVGAKYGPVMSFAATTLPIFPESPPQSTPNKVYFDEASFGTLIKLYEYDYKEPGLGTSHVLMKSGLMRQLELVLPECGLPVRVVEGRDFKGKPGSFQTNLFGILHRMEGLVEKSSWAEDENGDDQEIDHESTALALEGPPVHGELSLRGSVVPWTAYVFREDAGDRTRSGKYNLIFCVNGQKHAHEGRTFFSSKAVGLSFLSKHNTIFAVVDCTALTVWQREDLFKPSRDRMNKSEVSREFLDLLSDAFRTNDALQKLQNQQHQRMQSERLSNRAPIRKVLEQLLKSTPMLARFFKFGPELKTTRPFPGLGAGGAGGSNSFEGKKHPTYLRFGHGETNMERVAHLGSRVRIQFEIDAENNYFSRPRNHGIFSGSFIHDIEPISGNRGELLDGAFTYSLLLPDSSAVGDTLRIRFSVIDDVIGGPLVCTLILRVQEAVELGTGGKGKRATGNVVGGHHGGRTSLSDLDIVKCCDPIDVRSGCFKWLPGWTEFTAVTIEENPVTHGITYYVNVDNIHLRDYQKQNIQFDSALLEAKFMWSLVLLSLSIIEDSRKTDAANSTQSESSTDDNDDRNSIDRRDELVASMSKSIAQLVLPMMEAVGAMTSDLIEGDE
jgi:hypothetical protein